MMWNSIPFDRDLGAPIRLGIRFFYWACAALLAGTAALKLISLGSSGPILSVRDPLLGMPMVWFLICGSVLEGVGVLGILFTRTLTGKALAVRFVFGAIGGYRLGLYAQGSHFCSCLGTIGPELLAGMQDATVAFLLGGMVLVIFAGNEWILARYGRIAR